MPNLKWITPSVGVNTGVSCTFCTVNTGANAKFEIAQLIEDIARPKALFETKSS
jgi:hypothetical protein